MLLRLRFGPSVLLALCALLVLAAPAASQGVVGRVIDAESGEPVVGARVVLLRADGTAVAQTVSGAQGSFQLLSPRPGEHRLEVSNVGYRTTATGAFTLALQEQLVVDVRLSTAAIPLEPLAVTARRADPRHEATHEGFYARQQLLPAIGNSRAITRIDPEMINSRDVRDVMTWLRPPRRGGECLVVYWNGHLVLTPEFAEVRLETMPHDLEGLEYYRTITDAPFPFRQIPIYLQDCTLHSVLALWSRTGHYGDVPVDLTPSPRRVNAAAGIYHVGGKHAPGSGPGVELTAHWPVVRGFAIGVTARRTSHTLSAATTHALVPPIVAPPFVTPPGERPLTLWAGGLESRVTLDRRAGVWPVVAARLLVAHRSFTLQSSSAGVREVTVASLGAGAGLTVGAELLVRDRFAVHAALGHDRIIFRGYNDLEHRTNPTGAHWGGTSLRIGVGYALER